MDGNRAAMQGAGLLKDTLTCVLRQQELEPPIRQMYGQPVLHPKPQPPQLKGLDIL